MEKLITSGTDLMQFLILVLLIIAMVILLIVVINVNSLAKKINASSNGKIPKAKSFWESQVGFIPLENEKDILLDHDFDGIQELDNHLPPWWSNLFYASIIFAIVYVGIYHFLHTSPSQEQEYQNEVAEGKAAAEAYQAKMGTSIDEKTVKLLVNDANVVSKGKEVFVGKCVACHGQNGEGGVGPNLTDEFWLHGGTINDVYKTISYGVPEKGMISWKATLKPNEIQDVSNYILSIQGTNPANAKAPQGEKSGGSTAVAAPADTTKK